MARELYSYERLDGRIMAVGIQAGSGGIRTDTPRGCFLGPTRHWDDAQLRRNRGRPALPPSIEPSRPGSNRSADGRHQLASETAVRGAGDFYRDPPRRCPSPDRITRQDGSGGSVVELVALLAWEAFIGYARVSAAWNTVPGFRDRASAVWPSRRGPAVAKRTLRIAETMSRAGP